MLQPLECRVQLRAGDTSDCGGVRVSGGVGRRGNRSVERCVHKAVCAVRFCRLRVCACELSVCVRLSLREGERGSTNGTQTFM